MKKLFERYIPLIIFYVIIFLLSSVNPAYAQQKADLLKLNFKNLSTTDGFPTNEVQKVFQDREGFMWFATRNGLCKYDSYQITVYNTSQLNSHHLPDNNIFCLADDSDGNLWIGTYNGISRLNKRLGTFEAIEIQNSTNKTVSSILVTNNHDILIGLDDGLFRYDPLKNAFTHHSQQRLGNISLNAPVKSIIEDSNGEIWIGTWSDGLYRYSSSTNTFNVYPQLNQRNSAHIIYEDSRQNIWVGSWEGGLHLLQNPYDIENLQWKTFRHDANDPTSLSDDIVYDISEDINTNSLWIGTRSGLSILECDNPSTFINYSTTHETNKLPTNEINSIVSDIKGNIWIGSIGGGVLFTYTERSKFDFFEVNLPEIPTASVRSIFVDHDDNMWLGIGTYGIVMFDQAANQSFSQFEIPEFKEAVQNTTYDIKQKDSGEILFGTYGGGLWVYEKGKPITSYVESNCNFISDNRIRSIYIDSNQNSWIGTQYGLGVWRNNNEGFMFDEIVIDGKHLDQSSMIDITEDDTKKIWVATINNGIISIEGDFDNFENFTFKNYTSENKKINSNTITSLLHDNSGRLWAGAESGQLYLYDNATDSFINKSPKFSILGTLISSIQEDKEGNLWIGTNIGLVRLSFNDNSELTNYRVYTTADGLLDNFFIPKSSFYHINELFFGGYKGLSRFKPDQINTDIDSTLFYITDIRVLNTPFSTLKEETAHKISKQMPSFTERITIPHKYNNFSIHFATLNYKNPELNRYAYKLEGFDNDWRYTDSNHNIAYYNNLPAGKYTFHLRATTQNGVWNDEIKELRVNVLPPFWLSWWAYIIYFFTFAIIIYVLYRNAVNRINLRNQLRYSEMEQAKTEELNHAKLQFFTNVTHEFLTPLTIISATIDELRYSSPRNDGMYETLSLNINRLTRLLQQILEFRKAESGNLKLRVSHGNVSEFIRNSIEAFYPLIKKKKIHISFVSDPEDIHGLFDIDKLDKILYNLISNAVKYVKEGGAIRITLNYSDDNRDHIKIIVKDEGAGISSEDQKILFTRFYEGQYRKHNTTGTGIGLSLVRDLTALSHGSVSVKSELGLGSEFKVILPIDISYFNDSEIDSYEISKSKELEDADTNSSVKRHTVLVVEDNEDILELIQKLLSRDYQVITSHNGKDALLVLEHEKIDIIVTDIMMPEMDGIELCKLLKNNIDYSHIPLIILTAKSEEKDRALAYETGADAFISKPFNLNVLHARIRNLLKSRERIATDFKSQFVFEIKDLNITNLDEEFLQNAIDCVNLHLDDPSFDQQQFSEEMNVSRSTLYNKLKTLTGLNTSMFITNIRLKAACQIMDQNKNIRISDLAYAVGFNDPKYFSSCFKKEFKMRPTEYIDRFSDTIK